MIFGYDITVYTDHAAVCEIFKSKNLTEKIACWYCTIQEFSPRFKYLPGRANVVADALSSNASVGAVTGPPSPIRNFTLRELGIPQRKQDVWSKVIHALESGDETFLPHLPIPFSQFLLSQN